MAIDLDPETFDISRYLENITSDENHVHLEEEITQLHQIPLYGVIFLSVAYAAICITALVGNLLVLWLILPNRKMWTVTNMFLVNLAVADIIIAIFMPFHIRAALLQYWDPPEILCALCPFVQTLSVFVSVLTLSAIALHRYKTARNPFNPTNFGGAATFQISAIWIFSFLASLPNYLDYKVVMLQMHFTDDAEMTPHCIAYNLSTEFRWHYSQYVILFQYFVPLIIITTAYLKISRTLWQSTAGIPEDVAIQQRRQVTKMMIGIVLLFAVCWFPYQTYNILSVHVPSINLFEYINVVWFCIHWLAMSNSCCNPFVYAIYNASFRKEFYRRTARIRSLSRFLGGRRNMDEEEERYEMYTQATE